MKTTEYTYADRSEWSAGPWDSEPDKRQWTDWATGLPCLIVRQDRGHLCGYVGVAPSHPYYETGDPFGLPLDVHGGITFGRMCAEDESAEGAVCHIDPNDGDRFWLGFDLAHWGDTAPNVMVWNRGGTYRTFGYVARECERLAAQLAKMFPGAKCHATTRIGA